MMDPSYETNKGLENLKNAFLLFLIASALALIPLIGGLGAIIGFVGLIFLILGWRALGRSSLTEAPNYKSTGKWFVYAIIIIVIVGIAGTIASAALLVSSLAGHVTAGGTTTPIFPRSSMQPFLDGIVVTVAVVYLIWITTWVKMNASTKRLSTEVSQSRIARAGLLYLVQILVVTASGVGVFYSIFNFAISGVTSPTSAGNSLGSYYGMMTGSLAPLGVLGLAGSLIGIAASYFGYVGVKGALEGRRNAPPPPPPQLSPPPAQQQQGLTYCPRCGHRLEDANAKFCPSCGGAL